MDQKAGTSATVSILAAIGSYIITFTGHPVWGLIAGAVSIPLGVIGIIMAASPRVSGGFMSLLAIFLGVVATAVAILGIVGVILF